MDRRGRSGRPWERIKKRIQAAATECAKCGKPISADYRWPHPNSVTVGHIIPLTYGGDPLDIENLQAECAACNSGEGARITNARKQGREQQQRVSYRDDNY